MKKLLLGTALASGAMAGPGYAQMNNGAAAADDQVIVTALRREQTPQDAPVALTVFNGETLADLGVKSINRLEYFAPNFEAESQFGSSQTSFTIRGVGFRDYATNNSPTVGVYVDDVSYPLPIMTQSLLFDLERVEILRGPQGTLYGRNTTGGAVKFISALPSNKFSAGLTIEAARFGRVDAEAYLSGPLSEQLRIRIAGALQQGGDWQINRETGETLGGKNSIALRGLVEYDFADNVSLLLNLHGHQDKSDGLGLQTFNAPALGPTQLHTGRQTSWGPSAEFASSFGLAMDQAPFKDNEGIGGSLTLNADFEGANLVYIGAYDAFNRREYNDYDGSPLGAAGAFFESDVDVTSHEMRLQSNSSGPLSWIVGGYFSYEKLDEIYRSDFVEDGINGLAVYTPYAQKVETLGVFGTADYQITSTISLTAGVRYEDETRDLIDLGTFATVLGPLNFANGLSDGTLESRRLNSGEVTWKVGLNVDLKENILFYASASRGVKSGGFTAYNTLNPDFLDPFAPEELIAYEAGLKTDWADEKLQLNGSVYYYDYENQQIQSAEFADIVAFDVAVPIGRIVNAPKSEIYGGEFELLWKPTPYLQIGQTLGLKNGTFKEFIDLDIAASLAEGTAVMLDRAGQSLGFPNLSYSGFAGINGPVTHRYYWRARLDYSYRGATTPPLLGPVYRVDEFWLVDAQIAIGPDVGPWEVSLWARNILNADFDETRNFFTPGFDVAAPGEPVTYGVRASLRY